MYPNSHRLSTPTHFSARLFISIALLLLVLTTAAMAQDDAKIRIGVIDSEKVLSGSAFGKKALAELTAFQKQREDVLTLMVNEVKELQRKIADGRNSLSAQELGALQKQVADKIAATNRAKDDATRTLQAKRDLLLQELDRKTMPVIKQIAKEQGYQLIFRKFESGLIFADDALDITAQVIQKLDAGESK